MYELKPSTIERVLAEVGVAAVPGEKIQVVWGDTVRIKATIQYRGNALDDIFYGSIGRTYLGIFDEVLVAQVPIHFDESLNFVTYNLQVDIAITTDIGINTDYDIYVKIKGHREAGLPEVKNCIDVVGAPEFQNFGIVSYEKV
ncbi:hypothetical protein ES703_31705 [subsurface metagenome]